MRRVIVILTDGLRPDAITSGRMPSLASLGREYTRAVNTRTVRPSATVAALASLATGVSPETHGLVNPGLDFLSRLGSLRPLGRELARYGLGVTIVAGEMSGPARAIAWTLAAAAGGRNLVTSGIRARETARATVESLASRREGLTMLYLPDCDRAGHAFGWMSAPYLEAASEVDAAIGMLSVWAHDAVMIVLADHGGGGVHPTDHDLPHPVNDAIPLVLAGASVRRHALISAPTSLLDVPPTILSALGLPVPECYEGRVLHEAFVPAVPSALVAL
jgi:predicted AlkP superfamily pyrophosphatase or phosphodiesterase